MAEKWFPELCESNDDPRAQLLFDDGVAYMLARLIVLQVQSLRWEVNRFERALRFRGRKSFLCPDYCALQCSGE